MKPKTFGHSLTLLNKSMGVFRGVWFHPAAHTSPLTSGEKSKWKRRQFEKWESGWCRRKFIFIITRLQTVGQQRDLYHRVQNGFLYQAAWMIFLGNPSFKKYGILKNGPIWVAVATNNNLWDGPVFKNTYLCPLYSQNKFGLAGAKIGEVSNKRHIQAIFVTEHHRTIKPVIISTKEHSRVLFGSESGALSVGSSCKVL